MRKALFTFFFISVLAANGQEQFPKTETGIKRDTISKLHFGFVIGANASLVRLTDTNIYHASNGLIDTLDHMSIANGIGGSFFGFLFEYDFTKYLSLRLTPGFCHSKYILQDHWPSGVKTTTLYQMTMLQVPLHVCVGISVKKNLLRLLPGINLAYNYYNEGSIRTFTSLTAADMRFEISRRLRKTIAGIEFGYVRSLKKLDVNRRHYYSADGMVVDRIKSGCLLAGISLKF